MGVPEDRPIDTAYYHTVELPALPTRDRNIVPECWIEAPPTLLSLGDDLGGPLVAFKRRIGRWLLWRAGPAVKSHARYLALDSEDLSRQFVFRLWPDGKGEGTGPDGVVYARFRTWKEALRDSG